MPIQCTIVLGENTEVLSSKYSRLFYQLGDGKVSAKSFESAKSDLIRIVSDMRKVGNKLQKENRLESNPIDSAEFQFVVTNAENEITKDMVIPFAVIETMINLKAQVNYRKPRIGKQSQPLNVSEMLSNLVGNTAETAESAE